MSDWKQKIIKFCDKHEYCKGCPFDKNDDSDDCMYEYVYQQGRIDILYEIEDIISDVESCHKDHTENEVGEWLTFTVDYDKWADVFIKLLRLKEQGKWW